MRGRLITFEGIDKVGKSTQIALFNEYLQELGHTTKMVCEPGTTGLGEQVREWIFANNQLDAKTEVLLFFAARNELLCQVVKPALARGVWVIADRFIDSTFAYQGGGRGVADGDINPLVAMVASDVRADLTFYIDGPPSLSAESSSETFESQGAAFYARVRERYEQLCTADSGRIKKVAAFADGQRRSVAAVQAQIQQLCRAQFAEECDG